jgi:hypothetical protein
VASASALPFPLVGEGGGDPLTSVANADGRAIVSA